ncbi:hypothetical protein [uncultured Desulfobulbus sp.]|uniref:lipase family protein n=1 Tax=uncultured Desulfobulbus sp. TaxID=239745 RepID=UPI0029C8ACEE|nr:hypothetical protein [uncultured Desulfobulbus sp.]
MEKILVILLIILSSSIVHAESIETKPFTKAVASEVAIYSMMASNAYANDKEKTRFPIEMLGWRKVDLKGKTVQDTRNSYTSKTFAGSIFSNLQFDIWEDSNSNKTIIAFKGTKEKIDWVNGNLAIGISIPYKSAKKHVREYIDSHPDRKVSVTGHSLGGGVALSVSFWEGVDAIVFNTSPRIFDGLNNANESAYRLTVFQQNEILQKIRKWYPKFLKKINPDQIVETNFNYPGGTSHRSDFLAVVVRT